MDIGSFFGSNLFDAGLDIFNSNRAWNNTKDFTREQMAWQENMANTAYQRAAKDLEAAGLNRVLALGSPGFTPGAPGGNMPAPNAKRASYIEFEQAKQGISSAKAAENLTNQQARKASAEADQEEVKKTLWNIAKPYAKKLQENASKLDLGSLLKQLFSQGMSSAKDYMIGVDEMNQIDRQIRTDAMYKLRQYRQDKEKKKGAYEGKQMIIDIPY